MELRHPTRYLATDILDTPDDGLRYEVIDGELYVSAAPIPAHQHAVVRISSPIDRFLEERGTGLVFVAPTAVVLDEHSGVEPDIVFVAAERRAIIGTQAIEGAPDLIVEVLSPSTRLRDLDLKLRRYARAGVPHYWIVDVDARRLYEHHLVDGRYVLAGTHGPNGLFEPDLFPGLSIAMASLWL